MKEFEVYLPEVTFLTEPYRWHNKGAFYCRGKNSKFRRSLLPAA